jgi:Uri superfamily endonuclease
LTTIAEFTEMMQTLSHIPPGHGTYILSLELATSQTLQIGRLGWLTLPAGVYLYVGSAFGAGGLAGRLKHHLSSIHRPHWHIDYLRQAAVLTEIWTLECEFRREHDWAALLASMPGVSLPASKFGASDCDSATHLFYFSERPALSAFQTAASLAFPDDPLIQSLRLTSANAATPSN